MEYDTPYAAPPAPDLTIQPGDVLNIQVYSENATLAAPFNSLTGEAGQNSGKVLSYVVDADGDIDFPVFGLMNVGGKTTKEIKDEITNLISTQGYIKTPVVKVALGEFQVTVIGRTSNSIIRVTNGSLNLIDLLAKTGGINTNAKIKDVMVIRTENGTQTAYSVNFQTKEIFNSPVYWLHQNDIVYVKPKGIQLNNNGQLAISLVGTVLSAASVISNILLWWNVRANK
jgi:polysaccharide export outer membrane protein